MSTHPQYIVTPLAGTIPAVRIETLVPASPFHDESHPIILQSNTPEVLPLMQAFLSGLSRNTSWTSREHKANLYIKEGVLPDGCADIMLGRAMNNCRPAPTDWYCILAGDDELLEINVLNETLAHQLFDALLDGTLQLRFVEPDPV